jgi:hypothetical protein
MLHLTYISVYQYDLSNLGGYHMSENSVIKRAFLLPEGNVGNMNV